MSTWGIGDNHDSDEVHALKEQLRIKDAAHTTLYGEYTKREAEINELKTSLNDMLDKLRREADRVIQLDSDLKRRNEELANERLTRQNTEVALSAANRKLRDSEDNALELQSTIDALSAQTNSTSLGRSKLEQDNAALQTRVRALERELQSKARSEEFALRQSQNQPSNGRRPRQSSSETALHISVLEKEIAELRATSSQQAEQLQQKTEQLARARDSHTKLENERMASEKRLRRELEDVRATLHDCEEDLRLLRGASSGDDVAMREAELLERLEEEEQRVATLENELARSTGTRKRDLAILQDELDRTHKLLEEANQKASETEERMTELIEEKEEALDERDRLERERARLAQHLRAADGRISELEDHLSDPSRQSSAKSPDEATVATMEKLLNTIERLRGERDGLRRDLEFLNAENRFAVQSLEAKLTVATSAPPTPATDMAELNLLRGHVQAFQEQAERSARATVALAIVAQHAGSLDQGDITRIQELSQQLTDTDERLQHAQRHLEQRERDVRELEQQLSSATESLGSVESQVPGLRATIERLEGELSNERASHVETGAALADVEAQLTAANLALTDAEAERDALALEKTHLQQDLEKARQELADADERHGRQLHALSSGQPTAAAQGALRAQIQELEGRIDRRTAQIGMHQHDIARLEMNLKLQEERIAEMTAEMDVAQGEKDAMLEDCRTTRDQRDEALRKCDDLEEALETVEEARDTEVEGVVKAAFGAMSQRRAAVSWWRREVARHSKDVAGLQERIQSITGEKEALSAQIAASLAKQEHLAQALEDKASAFDALQQERDSAMNETQHMSSALSTLQAQLDQAATDARAAEEAKTAVDSQLAALSGELDAKDKELSSLRGQLTAVRDSHADRQSLDASIFAQEKAELELQLQDARASLAKLGESHQETAEKLAQVEQELSRAEDELSHHLSESALRSEAEEHLRDELAQAKKQREEEVATLQDQLKSVSDELAEITRLRVDADASRKLAEEELARTKEQLEARLAEVGKSLDAASSLEAELEQLRTKHDEETRTLRERLESITADLASASSRRDELEALHEQAVRNAEERSQQLLEAQEKVETLEKELAALRDAHAVELHDLEKRLEETTAELCSVRESQTDSDAQQREKVDELSRTVEELEGRITVLTKEADECRAELGEEKAAHADTKATTTAELHEAISRRDEAEAALADAEKELPAVRAQLEHAEATLAQAEEEKLNLEYQVTNLEAEVQRSKSLQRFLESQAADGERRTSTLEAELEELRTRCTALDRLAKTTEANLAMQSIQHEQTVTSLKRELNALRAQPRLEDEIHDLKEKNAEMEELLRAKCLEIEENDDRFIEMIKEKKKLTNKIDSLSRKVQNLQTKLAAANEAASTPAPASAPVSAPKQRSTFTPSPVLASTPVLSAPFASSSSSRPTRLRVVTAPAKASPDPAYQQPPPLPTARPRTPESRSRMVSGPSSLSRQKTPEPRIPPMPVFKAPTPERRRAPTAPAQTQYMPESTSSSSVVGVKRRAPDDFDDCGSLPSQPFTADCAPGPDIPAQPTTPRLRKALQTVRSGFTPVRHHTSRAGSTSPSRRATTGSGAAPVPHTISDVTNSPRASSNPEGTKGAARKGWLGKIKSGSSQSRPLSSRPPLFDPPGMR
ncbi:hypothetical protein BD413DRAFT_117998 [Trametes elegans]|nr:hypothetical protein BD413DRAFT_117998 [Trametes elegans]